MEEVLIFFNVFFKVEAEARFLAQHADKFEEYQAKTIALYSFCVPELKNNLGVVIRDAPLPKFPSFIPMPPPPKEVFNPRFIYKISTYENVNYGEIYVAYCSHVQPSAKYHDISGIIIAIKSRDGLKIAKNYIYDGDEVEWFDNSGLEDIKLKKLGVLKDTKKIMEPLDDKRSMKLYDDAI